MSYYPNGDPYEREPLESSRMHHDPSSRHPEGTGYGYSSPPSPSPYHDNSQWRQQNAPPPPRHGDNTWNREVPDHSGDMGYGHGSQPHNITPGADNFSETAGGGMAGIAYGVADRNARESGLEAMRNASRVPPPPSRLQHDDTPYYPGGGAYPYGGYGMDNTFYYLWSVGDATFPVA
jgi:hypothetical protein